jgi:hypothetical protein
MVTKFCRSALLLVTAGLLVACEVTPEKVELWKSTQNGPKKLAAAMVSPDASMDIRGKAGVALIEIASWDLLRESLQKMDKPQAEKVVDAMAPLLAQMVRGQAGEISPPAQLQGPGGEPKGTAPLTKLQVDAKDGLFIVLDYAGTAGRAVIVKALIEWCTKDYNIRAMAGDYNIRTIVKKIGSEAAMALVPLLNLDEVTIKYVAELIQEVSDPTATQKASEQLAAELLSKMDKVQEVHLVAAATVGGQPIGDALLKLATDKNVSAALQRFALRAFSEAAAGKRINPSEDDIVKLFAMAENTAYDQYQREETYYVIAQTDRDQDIPRLRKLLGHKSAFFRYVGLRCLLRMDGEKILVEVIREFGQNATGQEDVVEAMDRVLSFPELIPKAGDLLGSSSLFAQGVGIMVLAQRGKIEALPGLEKAAGSKEKLPKGFDHKTVGEAATAAIAAIKERG